MYPLDPNAPPVVPECIKNIYQNTDGYFGIYVYWKTHPLIPFDFTGAIEIKVCIPNADGTVCVLKYSLSQVQIYKAQGGQIRAFYTKAQSALWALGPLSIQIVATLPGPQDKIFVTNNAINVIAEPYPGV